MSIGSTTKAMTALALMHQVEAGKVDLEAPVTHYLPWFLTADGRQEQLPVARGAPRRWPEPCRVTQQDAPFDLTRVVESAPLCGWRIGAPSRGDSRWRTRRTRGTSGWGRSGSVGSSTRWGPSWGSSMSRGMWPRASRP
ncbi:serine hydrolase [Cystobacter fuscus]